MTTTRTETRPWGSFEVIYEDTYYWTKVLTIKPFSSLSLQTHEYRGECWVPLDYGLAAIIDNKMINLQPGNQYRIPMKTPHRIMNPTRNYLRVVEVASGLPQEDDIIRLQDEYGRTNT